MPEHRSLDRARTNVHEVSGEHNSLRDRAVEDALIELMGPVGAKKACDRNAICSRDDKLPDAENRDLYKDLAALAKVDGGSNTNRFKSDLKFINDKLTYTRINPEHPIPPDKFALPIMGINEKTHHALLSRNGEAFELINEDGLHTIEPATGSARPEPPAQATTEEAQWKRTDALTVSSDGVNQVAMGNCHFLGSAASLAEEQPDAIRNMISKNPNGKYTVTFPGDPSHPQTVEPPNSAESDFVVNGPNSEWIGIVAKAYRKLTGNALYDPGGFPERALELLTGKVAIATPLEALANSKEAEAQRLAAEVMQSALARHAPIVASSRSYANNYINHDGIICSHSYSLIGYDPAQHLVTLRNPQGLSETAKEKFHFLRTGVFQMPLDRFVHEFNRLVTV